MNAEIIIFFGFFLGVLTAILHMICAIMIFQDAEAYRSRSGKSLFLVNGAIWALATLLGGIFIVGIYWLIHYSTLNPTALDNANEEEDELSIL